jgi:hypothetical protein
MAVKLVELLKEPISGGFRLRLRCLSCKGEFPLSLCHHVKCTVCDKARCPSSEHVCEAANAGR